MAKSIFELRESKSKASDALRAYAKKTNGTETREIQTIAGKLDNFANTGNPGVVRDAAKVLKQMDTKSQAQVMSILNKLDPSMGKSLAFKMAGMKEEVELDEAQKEVTPKDVEAYLVKKGVAPKDAKSAVKKSFAYANKKYGGPTFAAAVKKIADVVWTLGEETEEQLEEKVSGEGYKPSSEKSKFGGYRAKLLNPQGKMSYLGSTTYKTAKAAEGEAAAYHDGYFNSQMSPNERMANRMVDAYKKKNAKDLYKKESADLAEAPEDKEPASPDEKSMAMDQAKFIKYVGDEIMEYLNKNKEFPEWMQNKLSGLHEKAKGFHATMAGKYKESVEEAWETDKGIEQKRKVSHDDTSESTKAYGKSQERMRDDKKKAAISSKDKATLGKIAAMLAKEKK
jgi:hypothetical protein